MVAAVNDLAALFIWFPTAFSQAKWVIYQIKTNSSNITLQLSKLPSLLIMPSTTQCIVLYQSLLTSSLCLIALPCCKVTTNRKQPSTYIWEASAATRSRATPPPYNAWHKRISVGILQARFLRQPVLNCIQCPQCSYWVDCHVQLTVYRLQRLMWQAAEEQTWSTLELVADTALGHCWNFSLQLHFLFLWSCVHYHYFSHVA